MSNDQAVVRNWKLVALGALLAVVLIGGGAVGGAWLFGSSRDDSGTASATAYWETEAGRQDLGDKAYNAIAAHAASKGYVLDGHGPPQITGLTVRMWASVVTDINGKSGIEKSRMWFEQSFAAGDGKSLTPLGQPKVALTESGL